MHFGTCILLSLTPDDFTHQQQSALGTKGLTAIFPSENEPSGVRNYAFEDPTRYNCKKCKSWVSSCK